MADGIVSAWKPYSTTIIHKTVHDPTRTNRSGQEGESGKSEKLESSFIFSSLLGLMTGEGCRAELLDERGLTPSFVGSSNLMGKTVQFSTTDEGQESCTEPTSWPGAP
jgi:hypothetical protein